jgi:hypothetical protein
MWNLFSLEFPRIYYLEIVGKRMNDEEYNKIE